MSDSRYGEYKQSKLPKPSRGRRVHGSGEDDGKFWRCSNCNFINNLDVRPVSDRVSYSGSEADVFDERLDNSSIVEDGYVVMTNNTGMGFWERHSIAIDYHSGCAFCGKPNYA